MIIRRARGVENDPQMDIWLTLGARYLYAILCALPAGDYSIDDYMVRICWEPRTTRAMGRACIELVKRGFFEAIREPEDSQGKCRIIFRVRDDDPVYEHEWDNEGMEEEE